MVTNVTLRPGNVGKRGCVYDVLLAGEVIVARSHDPEHDAARALLSRGIVGAMQTVGPDGSCRMRLDIETAAKLTTTERDKGGLGRQKWVPYATGDAPARVEPIGRRM